jgi:hypothetical protein
MIDFGFVPPPPAYVQEIAPEDVRHAVRVVLRQLPSRSERDCALEIAHRESRFDMRAANLDSTAVGVWQLIWGKRAWSLDKQFQEAHRYAIDRYGSWCDGLSHHDEKNWW